VGAREAGAQESDYACGPSAAQRATEAGPQEGGHSGDAIAVQGMEEPGAQERRPTSGEGEARGVGDPRLEGAAGANTPREQGLDRTESGQEARALPGARHVETSTGTAKDAAPATSAQLHFKELVAGTSRTAGLAKAADGQEQGQKGEGAQTEHARSESTLAEGRRRKKNIRLSDW